MADTPLSTLSPIQKLETEKLNLVLNSFGSQLVKPLLLTPTVRNAVNKLNPFAGDNSNRFQDPNRFDQHEAFPTRDNIAQYAGRPVITNVQIQSPNYEVENYNNQTQAFEKSKYAGVSLNLTTVLVDVQMGKRLIKTEINGLNGTVKEFIADGDFAVTIRGAIVNPRGTNYPTTDVQKFLSIMKAPTALVIISDYLQLFPVHNIVVESYTLPQKEGTTNTQLFEINAVSDNPIEIIKIKKA